MQHKALRFYLGLKNEPLLGPLALKTHAETVCCNSALSLFTKVYKRTKIIKDLFPKQVWNLQNFIIFIFSTLQNHSPFESLVIFHVYT